MTRIRRITVSQVEGSDTNNTDPTEIRPFGETAFYLDQNQNPNKLTLMMFDGTRTHLKSKVLSPGVLFGSGADSGDGASLDTIKLIPDATLHYNNSNYGNDQYLIVDPTGPDHIHLRAGGTIDNSNAELYIGGETSHLRVGAGLNPPVYISSNNQNWTFGADGILTLPSGNTTIGNTLGSDAIISAPDTTFGVVSQGSAGVGVLQWLDSIATPTTSAGIVVNSPYAVTPGSVQIYTGSVGIPPQNAWTFGTDGSLALPTAGKISNGASTPQVGSTLDIATAQGGGLTGWGNTSLAVDYNADIISTYTVGSTITWQDGTTATITGIDNYGPIYIDIFWDTPKTGDLFPITLKTSNYVAAVIGPQWTFGTDGTTQFPNNKVKPSIGNILSIETETLPTDPPTTIAISGADFTSVNLTYTKDGANSIWYPAGYIPGTDPYIEFTGSQYEIFVPGFGQALYVNTGTINIPLAQWNTNPPLGSIPPTGVYTYPTTYTRAWQFGPDGAVTFPLGTLVSELVTGPDSSFGILANQTPGRSVLIRTSPPPGVFNKDWVFDSNGDLTVPGSINSINSINLAAGDAVNITSNNTVAAKTWTFDENGNLTLPAGGTVSYTPTTPADWAGTAPTTIQEAIDRLAAAVKALNTTGA